MKKLLLSLLTPVLLVFGFDLPVQIEPRLPRKIQIGDHPQFQLIEQGKLKFELVVPNSASPSAKFAAKEAAEQLSVMAGAPITPLPEATGDKTAIVIGDKELAAKLGLDVQSFDRDAFVIRSWEKGVLIIGRDDPKSHPCRTILSEHGSVFGTYDFLERFAGIRYYFPGKIGTVIPKKQDWSLPAIDIYDRPDLYQRRFNDYNHGNKPIICYSGADWGKNGNINKLRNRYESFYIPACHGLRSLGYRPRFEKTHPEYFALRSNGTRAIARNQRHDLCHLCFSSDIKKEITLDAISFLKGEPASVRGVCNDKDQVGWQRRIFQENGHFFNIEPNDGMVLCQCPECKKYLGNDQDDKTKSDFMWKVFTDISNDVKQAGVPGYLTISIYSFWKYVPPFNIPDNLLVEMATRGPWNELSPTQRDKEMELMKEWYKKLGHKLWLWTYPGKYGGAFPGIPHTTPRYAASFLRRARPYIFGIYYECEADYLIFNYLNYHVYGKMMWNLDTDVEKLLDEHAQNLYGPAAKPIKEYFDSIERNWMKIASHSVETLLGPATVYPSDLEMWETIYSPQEIARLDALFDQAEKLAANAPDYLERVQFLRHEMWLPTMQAAETYCNTRKVAENWNRTMPETNEPPVIDGKLDDKAWKQSTPFFLTPLEGLPAKVKTSVQILRDHKNFYFGFTCENLEEVKTWERPHDSQDIWRDSGVEVFLSPDKSMKRFYQLMVNASGCMADLKKEGVNDWSWESGAECKSLITPGKGWVTEIRLPQQNMDMAAPSGMRANFTRMYIPEKGEPQSYCWGPFVQDNPDLQRFGTILFKQPDTINLIKDGLFAAPANKRFLGEWWTNSPAFLRDETYFASAGASARLTGPKFSFFQELPALKKNTEYLLRFCLKLQNVKPLEPKWSGFYVRIDDYSNYEQYYPPMRNVSGITGTTPWKQLEFRFKTSDTTDPGIKPQISFVLRNAEGNAWIDNVELYEQTK